MTYGSDQGARIKEPINADLTPPVTAHKGKIILWEDIKTKDIVGRVQWLRRYAL